MTAFRPDPNYLEFARSVVQAEADALRTVSQRLDHTFLDAVGLIRTSPRVVIAGVGKSAHVGTKIAATMNSTGTRASFMDPVAAMHGDLGMLQADDVVLLVSHSGNSPEIIDLVKCLGSMCRATIGLTGSRESFLAKNVTIAVVYGPVEESCPMGLAPSTSVLAQLAVGDAMAFSLCKLRGFSSYDFARLHPGGSLGRKLAPVNTYMRKNGDLRIAQPGETVRAVFEKSFEGRRTGAVLVTNTSGALIGIFTDSDLARLLAHRQEAHLDLPLNEVMTPHPIWVPSGSLLGEAIDIMRNNKISELPVLDSRTGVPIGILDITDVIDLF